MNKGNLKGKRRTANKGLSPVIAAVILIAVTVAIAVAAGGYFFGLFGTQTSRAQVSIRSVTLVDTGSNVTLTLELQNAGGLGDTISAINMPGTTVTECSPSTTCGAGSPDYLNVVDANVGSFTTKWDAGTAGTYSAGQTVSFTIRMSSGLVIPVAVSVS